MRTILLTVTLAVCAVPASAAAPIPAEKRQPKLDARTKEGVDRALKYLKGQQNGDGSWGNTAITGLTLLAFMSNGNVPNQGLYGPEVAKGVRFLMSCARDDGYLVGARGGNMYCHGMATLALSQAYGMTGDEEVRKVLKKAVDLIVKTQNNEGGWRYEPTPTGADISVTIMQVMALRGAKDSGLHVPDDDDEEGRWRTSTAATTRAAAATATSRTPPAPATPAPPPACACSSSAATTRPRRSTAAVKYMESVADDRQHYWYGHYYAAHAMHQVGGKTWEDYYARMKATLLGTQRLDRRVVQPHRVLVRPGVPDRHRRAHPVRPDALPAHIPTLNARRLFTTEDTEDTESKDRAEQDRVLKQLLVLLGLYSLCPLCPLCPLW